MQNKVYTFSSALIGDGTCEVNQSAVRSFVSGQKLLYIVIEAAKKDADRKKDAQILADYIGEKFQQNGAFDLLSCIEEGKSMVQKLWKEAGRQQVDADLFMVLLYISGRDAHMYRRGPVGLYWFRNGRRKKSLIFHPKYGTYEEIKSITLKKQEHFLLMSTGFDQSVSDKWIFRCYKESDTPEQWLMLLEDKLIQSAAEEELSSYSAIAVYLSA